MQPHGGQKAEQLPARVQKRAARGDLRPILRRERKREAVASGRERAVRNPAVHAQAHGAGEAVRRAGKADDGLGGVRRGRGGKFFAREVQ